MNKEIDYSLLATPEIPKPLEINESGLALIKFFEGLKLTAYQDIVGVWTIGYGATGPDIVKGLKWDLKQCEDRLKLQLKEFEGAVIRQAEHLNLNDNQFSALVSFTYNLGPKSLANLVKDRGIADVQRCMLLYVKAGGKEVKGLKVRRYVEKDLFNQPAGTSLDVADKARYYRSIF